MPVEQMNISLPPRMARFIRGKVKAGEYTNASEVVRDAVRHMQEAEAEKKDRRAALAGELSPADRESVRQSVQRGIMDIEEGRVTELDQDGLRRHFEDIGKRGKKRLVATGSQRPA